jgi:serine-type D-Ala-D-Ala carboxypeptidase (penicillin-binding protein 5/6)
VLARIVRTREATVVGDAGATSFGNRNLLLESYRGAIGIKTGFTALAGNVLVSAAERKGTRVIAVALGSIDSFVDSAALLDHGFARLRRTVLVSEGEPLAGLVFDTAGSTSVVAGERVRGLGSPETIDVTFVPDDAVNLPVAAGEAVGVLEVRDPSGRVIASIDALAEGALESPEPSLITRAVSGLMRGVSAIFGGL